MTTTDRPQTPNPKPSPSAFGSACNVTDKFLKQVEKSGVVDNVVNWAKFKQCVPPYTCIYIFVSWFCCWFRSRTALGLLGFW